MHARHAGAAIAVLAVALAGCTGQFSVTQTEPLRIQLEGGGTTMDVQQSDSGAKRVVVEGTDDVEQVNVDVKVTSKSGPCKIHVVVQDADGNTLDTRDVDAGGSGNMTGNGTAGTTVTQTIVVNVHGKDNIVVLANSLQGDATVTISATGSGNVGTTTTGTMSTTDTGTMTTDTATDTGTMTTTDPGTTTGSPSTTY